MTGRGKEQKMRKERYENNAQINERVAKATTGQKKRKEKKQTTKGAENIKKNNGGKKNV